MSRHFLASWRVAATALAASAVTFFASPEEARANGRFPESNQLVFSKQDPDLMILRVTFGLLVSHDRGKTWDWVCESSIGFSGVEDPMYTVTPSKTYVATTFQGLTISRDQACSWNFAQGELYQQVFIDLSGNPKDDKNIVVFASSYDMQDDAGNILFSNRVWETKDEAFNFTPLAGKIDPALLGYTIDLSNSDPNRIYITAVRNPGPNPTAVLLVSRNHGATWEEEPVPLEPGERAVFVAAVDPNNADRVYMRTSNAVDKPSRLILRDAVDGGQPTLRTIKAAQGALLGFALSEDGSKVYVGGPKDGIHVASTSDFGFVQKTNKGVQCLALSGPELWACSSEDATNNLGFVVGVSSDEGASFQARLHFCDGNADAPGIRGPLSCAAGTTSADRCNSLWPQQKALLGCSGGFSDGGNPDGSFEGGTGFEPTPSSPKNCDCHASPAGPWGAVVTVAGAAIALLRRARRKKS
jgi:hypothetical protein